MRVRIVTDSGAQFTNPVFLQQHAVTIVPNHIRIGSIEYLEGVDLSAEEALRLMLRDPGVMPAVVSPSEAEFVAVYNRLAAEADAIVSIHPSRSLYTSWANATAAAQQAARHCQIVVIDSQALAAGLGMLVRVAADAAAQQLSLDEIVKVVRGAIERVYTVFYVESISSLLHNRLISASHAVLGTLLGVKPFLTLENGCLTPIEKVRSRMQAVERLVEFVTEFTDIEDFVILQSKPHAVEPTRIMQERLALEFPGRAFPHAVYPPSLAALVGIDALGVFILEEAPRHAANSQF